MMYGVNDTPNLHFATAAGKIGNGLDEQLKNFVQEHPDTNLIIIDTMQKIREVGGEATVMPATMRSSAESSSLLISMGSVF